MAKTTRRLHEWIWLRRHRYGTRQATRFCVWGGRPGDVWIGSRQDFMVTRLRRLAAREAEAQRRAMRALSAAMDKVTLSMGSLGKACVSAAEAFQRLAPSVAALERSSTTRVQDR